jgi:hypothetical protein
MHSLYLFLASNGGIVYLESCILDRCGGGGVVSDGEGSLIEMNYCTVRHMRQIPLLSPHTKYLLVHFPR